ncbi:MAG: hypothetical protein ACE5FC_10685 [Myxococcota bacterium]
MTRFIALCLTLTLALGAWACGRKSAPRLAEGERLKVSKERSVDSLSVYSPYEEEIAKEEESVADLEAQVRDAQKTDVPDVPDVFGRRERKDNWRLLGETEEGAAKRARPIRDAVERVQEAVEETGDKDRALPDTEQDAAPLGEGGLPPSPGGPTEGGF